MKRAAAALLLALLSIPTHAGHAASQEAPATTVPSLLYFPNANSRPTYFSVHHFREAWSVSGGEGVRVGILDHSFGLDIHSDLYAGGRSFHTDRWGDSFASGSHHGYWMVRAIDWAIENQLDILTYSAQRFSSGTRGRLDGAVAPDLEPADLKRHLMETAYPMEFEGMPSTRTMDVWAAIQALRKSGVSGEGR